MSTKTRPASWPTEEQQRHADAGCAHPDECRLETAEDLTKIEPADLHKRIGDGRDDRDAYARMVCYALREGRDTAYHMETFEAAESALEVLYAENRRRCNEHRARGLI